MFDDRTRQTYESAQRWFENRKRHADGSLESTMDKFFTLYVAFDVLVFHATFSAGLDPQFKIKENTTIRLPQWANHDRIWTALNDGAQATKDLSTLRHLIRDGGEFFLYWKRTELGDVRPQKGKNRALYDKLGNQSQSVAVEGVLEYLYKVRCNLFHGSKMLEKPQMQILEPSIRCLERIIEVGLAKLREELGDPA
jgi:hypothetical protein